MYEELLVQGEKLGNTKNEKIFIEKDTPLSEAEVEDKLRILEEALETKSNRAVKKALKEVVPTYRAPEDINGAALEEKVQAGEGERA